MSFKADAEKIKRWREERHWSQEHLADLAGIGLRTLQRVENGEPASAESLKALAAAYNVDVMALAVDQQAEARKLVSQKNQKARDALRLSLGIHFAGYIIGMVAFLGIGLSDRGNPWLMQVPMVWWTVGLVAHAATVGIVELTTRFSDKYDT
ncbi:MAG: helix-turn-helix transcriptional regulator [Pseudomonadota bacterium]